MQQVRAYTLPVLQCRPVQEPRNSGGALSDFVRQDRIVALLDERPFASVRDLQKLIGVSGATIRRDIEKLNDAGRARKVYGGVAAVERGTRTAALPFVENRDIAVAAKRAIAREAERLATLLESARAQARTNGSLVIWRPMPQGFRFEGLPQGVKMPGQWLQTAVTVQPATPVVLGPEPLIPRQTITLSLPDGNSPPLQLVTDGLRPFKVQSLQGSRP